MENQQPCPAWCTGEHLRDRSTDPTHESLLASVPVIALVRSFGLDESLVRTSSEVMLDVAAFRYPDENETWIAIVEAESQQQRIEISLESAHRVMAVLGRLLGTIRI